MKRLLLLLLLIPCIAVGGQAEKERFLAISDRFSTALNTGAFYRISTRDLSKKFSALTKVYVECKESNQEACTQFMELAQTYEEQEGKLDKQCKKKFDEFIKKYIKDKRHSKRMKKVRRRNRNDAKVSELTK